MTSPYIISFNKLVVKFEFVGFVPPIVGLMLGPRRPRFDARNVRFTVKYYSSISSGWRWGHNISPTEQVRKTINLQVCLRMPITCSEDCYPQKKAKGDTLVSGDTYSTSVSMLGNLSNPFSTGWKSVSIYNGLTLFVLLPVCYPMFSLPLAQLCFSFFSTLDSHCQL